MSEETEEVYERAKKHYKPEGEEYLRSLVEVSISMWHGQKRKLGKDRKLMEDAMAEIDNKIAEADYHLGQLKQIQIEKG